MLPLSLSLKARRTGEQPISELMAAAVGRPELISFAAGLVDYDTLPVDEVGELLPEVLKSRGRKALQYGTTSGDLALREHVLAHFAKLEGVTPQELGLTPEHVVVTTGSQQALYLISDVLLDPGDIAIAAEPSYFVYTGLLQSLGVDVRTVPMDAGGLRVDRLEALFDDLAAEGVLERVKLVYCQSYHQNPTGLTLVEGRRRALNAAVAATSKRVGRRIILLEDAAYRELGDTAESLPSLKRYDPHNQFVATTCTFSKPFAPGLKTGYSFLPADLAEAVLAQKGNHDFGSPNLCQHLLRDAMTSGAYVRHLDDVRAGYTSRRRQMLASLEQHMPAGLSWTQPTGGLYVWLTLPPHVQTGRGSPLLEACAKRDVLYVPGEFCYAGKVVPHNHLRLCHATVPFEKIDLGIARLADAVREAMGDPGVSTAPQRKTA